MTKQEILEKRTQVLTEVVIELLHHLKKVDPYYHFDKDNDSIAKLKEVLND